MLTKTLLSNTPPDTFGEVAVAGFSIHLMSSVLFPDCISHFLRELVDSSSLVTEKIVHVFSSYLSGDI